jgi:hypothetical protein
MLKKKTITTYRMGKKIFVSNSSEQGLRPRIYKEFKNLNTKRSNNQMKREAYELNRHTQKK